MDLASTSRGYSGGIPGEGKGSERVTVTPTRDGGKARSPSGEKAEGDTQLTFSKSWKQHIHLNKELLIA